MDDFLRGEGKVQDELFKEWEVTKSGLVASNGIGKYQSMLKAIGRGEARSLRPLMLLLLVDFSNKRWMQVTSKRRGRRRNDPHLP